MAPPLLLRVAEMRKHRTNPAGFTVVEMVLVVAVVAIIATMAVPALISFIHRGKIEGISSKTSILTQRSRMEAMKRGVRTVVSIDTATNEVFAFADIHGVLATDPPDGLFNPIDGMTPRTSDYAIGRYRLPSGVSFTSPTDTGMDSVDGFVNPGNPDPPDRQVVFLTDGSVLATGAFRFADERGNYLEVRVAPQVTGKTQVRKYDDSLPANADGSNWYARREGGQPWTWY